MPADRLDFAADRTDRPDDPSSALAPAVRPPRAVALRPDPAARRSDPAARRPSPERGDETKGARSEGGFDPGLPTVADALAVASLQAGQPEVLAGSVDAPVRWVHVSDSERVAALLDGGELLLTTGAGWSGGAAQLEQLVDGLADAGLAGIVLELGTRFAVAPPALVAACRRRDLALVALEREVKFVTVTEQVHRRIIAGQVEALQERQRLHELFTGLSLRGAPIEVVVRETARALRAPVVLEDLAHEAVVTDTAGLAEAAVLAGWSGRSRRLPEAWTRVPVAARGTQWGELVALAGPPHPAGRATVLEQAATALALSRLADGDDAWARLRADALIAAVLGEQYAAVADIEARLEASGFPVHGRTLFVAVSLSGPAPLPGPASAPATASAPGPSSLPRPIPTPRPISTPRPTPAAGALEGTAARRTAPSRTLGDQTAATDGIRILSAGIGAERILLASLPAGARLPDTVLSGLDAGAVSDPAATTAELLAALPVVRRLARQAAPGELLRVADRPLARLAAELSGDHRLQQHSARLLGPLIRHDDATGGDLLRVLRAVVAHPSNRTAAASASHLSRSVFYQRLALISDLLGADLDDGETLSALHLALLAHAR